MEAGATNAQHAAERLHGMLGLPVGDEPEDAHRLSPSFAKNTAAFFKISRSSRSTRTSRRSSSRSSDVGPGCSPTSIAACDPDPRTTPTRHRGRARSLSARQQTTAAQGWPKQARVFDMPHWLPPFGAAAFAVLLLNILLMVQRAREQSKSWPARFLRDLRHWDGRLPDDLDRHVHT